MKPDYDRMLDNLTSSYLEATESDDFFKQLRLARDTAIIRLLKAAIERCVLPMPVYGERIARKARGCSAQFFTAVKNNLLLAVSW